MRAVLSICANITLLLAQSGFFAHILINADQENIINSCSQFFNDCSENKTASEIVSNDYNFFIRNYNKSVSTASGIKEPQMVFLRQDETETQIITSHQELFGSTIFGSFVYDFKSGPLQLFMDSMDCLKTPFIQGKYLPTFSGIVKGFARRSQRAYIHVYAGGQNHPLFDSFFSLFARKVTSKELNRKLISDTCYYRKERCYEIVFDDDMEKSNIAVIIGKKPVRNYLCINVYPVGNGFIGLNVTGNIAPSPLRGKIVTKKEIAVRLLLSSIVNTNERIRSLTPKNFSLSWSVLSSDLDFV